MADKQSQEMESERWAGEMGDKWNHYIDQFEGMIAPVGEAAIRHAQFKADEGVIDIGCGGGDTTFDIAPLVNKGHVTGLDLSEVLIATANRRLKEKQLANVDFVCADAATVILDEKYDVLFSRFGVMFFEDPHVAFRNMRKFLRPEGRLSFVCWGPPTEQPWVGNLMAIAAKYVELPPPVPNAPGPFAFGDKNYLQGILQQAGFTNIDIEGFRVDLPLGGKSSTPTSAARFVMDALFLGDALQDEPDDIKHSAYEDAVTLLGQYVNNGSVELEGNTWLVGANCKE